MGYAVHDYIIHAGSGVCYIDDICSMKVQGAGEKDYYKLVPLYENGSTIYTPFDRAPTIIRKAATGEEIHLTLREISGIEPLDIADDRAREESYKSLLKENTCKAWLTMIRTAYHHNLKRAESGKKPTQLDERYLASAENLLSGEVALALGIEKEDVRDYILNYIETRKTGDGEA